MTSQRMIAAANLDELRVFVHFVSEFAQKAGLGPELIPDIELAVEECVVNVCTYAYPGGEGQIAVECRKTSDQQIEIEIVDNGVAYNPLDTPAPDLAADLSERPIGGLGIFLIKQMAHAVDYRRQAEQNHLTLIFRNHPL